MPNRTYLSSMSRQHEFGIAISDDPTSASTYTAFEDAMDEIADYPTPKRRYEAAIKFARLFELHASNSSINTFYDAFVTNVLPELPFEPWERADQMMCRILGIYNH